MRNPCSAHDENIEASIVVVIGLQTVQSAELPRQPRLVGLFGKFSVSQIAEKCHLAGRIKSRNDQIKQSILVKIVHDRPPRLIQPIDADQVSDIPKSADIELGVHIVIQWNPEAGGELNGVFSQRQVSQIQQPANLEIFRKLLEVLREVSNGEPRTFGVGMSCRFIDRKNARAFTSTENTVFILSLTQGSDPLQED